MNSFQYPFWSHSSLKDGLVFYTGLNGNSVNVVSSSTTTDSNITYSLSNGKINQGAGLNGTNSKIGLSSQPTSKRADYTYSVWCKWNALNNTLTYNENFNNTVVFGLGLRSAGGTIKAVGFTNGTGGGEYSADSLITPTIGVWYHIVGTFKYDTTATNRITSIYVNGVLKAQASPSGGTIPGGGNNFELGRTNTIFFNGAIDEFGVWNRVLTSNEIALLYNNFLGKQYPF